jgi:hypothetical protein
MAGFLTLASFQGGKYNIPDASSGQTDDIVQERIDNYEKWYLCQLLGATLGKAIYAYGSTGSGNAAHDAIIAAFQEDDAVCSKVYASQGLAEFLKAAVFFEYQKNAIVNAMGGVTIPKQEVSEKTSAGATLRYAEAMFNDQLDTKDAIQWKCANDPDTYPDYNGQLIEVKVSNLI